MHDDEGKLTAEKFAEILKQQQKSYEAAIKDLDDCIAEFAKLTTTLPRDLN